MISDFINHLIDLGGRRYRVCFYRGGRCMGVWRKGPSTGKETALDIDGPTARKLIAIARKQSNG